MLSDKLSGAEPQAEIEIAAVSAKAVYKTDKLIFFIKIPFFCAIVLFVTFNMCYLSNIVSNISDTASAIHIKPKSFG